VFVRRVAVGKVVLRQASQGFEFREVPAPRGPPRASAATPSDRPALVPESPRTVRWRLLDSRNSGRRSGNFARISRRSSALSCSGPAGIRRNTRSSGAGPHQRLPAFRMQRRLAHTKAVRRWVGMASLRIHCTTGPAPNRDGRLTAKMLRQRLREMVDGRACR